MKAAILLSALCLLVLAGSPPASAQPADDPVSLLTPFLIPAETSHRAVPLSASQKLSGVQWQAELQSDDPALLRIGHRGPWGLWLYGSPSTLSDIHLTCPNCTEPLPFSAWLHANRIAWQIVGCDAQQTLLRITAPGKRPAWLSVGSASMVLFPNGSRPLSSGELNIGGFSGGLTRKQGCRF